MDDALCNLRQHAYEKREAFHKRESELLERMIELGVIRNIFEAENQSRTAYAMILATNSLLPYGLSPRELGDRSSVEDRTNAIIDLLIRALYKRTNP